MERYGIIYQATNILDGKVYIGQTVDTIKVREANHFAKSKNSDANEHFRNAIKKYGRNSFIWEELCVCNSKEELDETEQKYIWLNNSSNNIYGYNISIGGHSRTKIDMQEAVRLLKNGMLVKDICIKLDYDRSQLINRFCSFLGKDIYHKIVKENRKKYKYLSLDVPKELLQEYIDKKYSMYRMTQELGITREILKHRIKYYFGEEFYKNFSKYNKEHKRGNTTGMIGNSYSKGKFKHSITKEYLEDKINENCSISKIAKECNVDKSVIKHRIKLYFGEDYYKDLALKNKLANKFCPKVLKELYQVNI